MNIAASFSQNSFRSKPNTNQRKSLTNKKFQSCIENMKQTSAKNAQHLPTDKKQTHNEQLHENYVKFTKRSKQRQRSIKRLERVLSNKQDSIWQSSKYSYANKNNVYDSFSMSNRFLEMSSTPDNKTRYASNNNLIYSSDIGARKEEIWFIIDVLSNLDCKFKMFEIEW